MCMGVCVCVYERERERERERQASWIERKKKSEKKGLFGQRNI